MSDGDLIVVTALTFIGSLLLIPILSVLASFLPRGRRDLDD